MWKLILGCGPINLGGQFAILGTNVAAVKYCYFDEIYTVNQSKP